MVPSGNVHPCLHSAPYVFLVTNMYTFACTHYLFFFLDDSNKTTTISGIKEILPVTSASQIDRMTGTLIR